MPIANVIQGQTKPLTGWKHVLSKVGEGLGQGLESGMVQGANLSLQDKMQTLQDERAYAQQEKLLALKQKQNEAIVRSQADKFRKMGGEFVPFADAYEAAGGNAQLAKMFVDYGMLGSQNTSQMPSGMQNVEALGPTRQQMMAKNMLMPIENQEALPEQQEMAPVQQSSIQQPNRPYDQQITATSQLPSLDDYARKMSPQYDRLPEASPVKAKILNQAKIRRDADAKTQENLIKAEKLKLAREDVQYKREREKTELDRDRFKTETVDVDSLRNTVRNEESAIEFLDDAIKNNATGPTTMNYIGDLLNIPGLKSADACLFQAAVKQLFTGSLSDIPGSKLNQFIDKQVFSMTPEISRSKAGNLAMLEAIKNKVALGKERIRLQDELSDKYEGKPKEFLKEKSRLLDEFRIENQKRSAYNIQKIKEDEMIEKDPKALMKMERVGPDTPLTLQRIEALKKKFNGDVKKSMQAAKAMGFAEPNLKLLGIEE